MFGLHAHAVAGWKAMCVKPCLRVLDPHHLVRIDTRSAPLEQRHTASRSHLRWKLFSRTDLRPVRENNFPSRQRHPARARRGTEAASDTAPAPRLRGVEHRAAPVAQEELVVDTAMSTDVRHDFRALPPGPAGARARACHGTTSWGSSGGRKRGPVRAAGHKVLAPATWLI